MTNAIGVNATRAEGHRSTWRYPRGERVSSIEARGPRCLTASSTLRRIDQDAGRPFDGTFADYDQTLTVTFRLPRRTAVVWGAGLRGVGEQAGTQQVGPGPVGMVRRTPISIRPGRDGGLRRRARSRHSGGVPDAGFRPAFDIEIVFRWQSCSNRPGTVQQSSDQCEFTESLKGTLSVPWSWLLSHVLPGHAGISPEMALHIERWLGVERGGRAEVWAGMLLDYDRWRARHGKAA